MRASRLLLFRVPQPRPELQLTESSRNAPARAALNTTDGSYSDLTAAQVARRVRSEPSAPPTQIWPVDLNVWNFIFSDTLAIRSGSSPAPFLSVRSEPASSSALATSVR